MPVTKIDFTDKNQKCTDLSAKAAVYLDARKRAVNADGLAQSSDFYAKHGAAIYAACQAAQDAMYGDADPATILAPLIAVADSALAEAAKRMADADVAAVTSV